jgi:hypothetical protein
MHSVLAIVLLLGSNENLVQPPLLKGNDRSHVVSKVQDKLSAEEIVLAAKMRDHYRRFFSEKLSVEQRKTIVAAVAEGMAPDEAMEKFYTNLLSQQ